MARVRMPGLLDGELQEIARLRVRAGQYQLSADDVSQATLTIPEDGPVVGLRDWVSLYDEDGLMGVYRVTNIAQTVKRSIQLTLLHGIDILADSYWAEEREYTGSVRGYLEALLGQQTALIDGTAPWALGDCEDTETTLKVKISYGRLSELIREAVPEGGGYQLEYDQTVWPWRVHLRAKPTTAAAEFRVARNITSATVTYNDADLCTRLILSNTSGGESRVRVYNAGAIAQAEWGIVTKTASIDTSDTLTSDSWPEAEAWVANFFRLHAAPSVQIQIEGRELYRLTGDRWDRASLGRVCRVSLPEYGHTFEERVVSLTYPDPWGDPDRVVVSLANALPQFSEQVKLIEKTARSASRAAGGAARKADQTAEELERKEVIYQTSFQKTDREIAGIASATGLQFNQDGTPVLDEDGNFVYSETHPDNALIAQISLQAGRYDRIIQATGISETPSQGEVSLVTQISQTHQQISNAAIATGIVWVDGDPTADPPTEGHYEVNPNAVSSSLYKQLANQIDQKVTVSDLESKVSTAGFIKLQAAKDAASAMIGADLKDGNGVITSAKIKALVEGDQSLIQLVAQQVQIDADDVTISGTVTLGDVLSVYNGTGIEVQGDCAATDFMIEGEGGADSVSEMLQELFAVEPITGISLTEDVSTHVWTLSWTSLNGTASGSQSFSRAASIQTVSGSWSGSTYTVAADASGTALPKSVTIDAILAGGGTSDFSAQIRDTSSGPSPVIIDSNAAHGYLAKSGNSVVVYTSRSGSTYSGPVASLSFQPEITAAVNTALGNVTVSGSWSGGAITIANSANSNTIVDYLRAGTATWNGTTVTVPVQHSTTPDTTASFADTGQSVSVNVSGKLYNPGTITPTSSAQTISVPNGYIGFSGPLNIAAASGSGGKTISEIGLYYDTAKAEEVPNPITVDSTLYLYPIVTFSDDTTQVGSRLKLLPSGESYTIIQKPDTITANGTYYASSDDVDGWSKVVVNVPTSGGGSHNIAISGAAQSDTGKKDTSVYTVVFSGIQKGRWYTFQATCNGGNGKWYQFYVPT